MECEIGIVAPPIGEAVREVERLGVDSLWVGGHLASPNSSPEPMVWLAQVAEQSQRVAVGTATLVLPWYSPAIIAKQLADIDRACGGRLIVGVGAGGEYPDDFAAAGVPIEERYTRLDESIGLLRRFWSAEPVSHDGRHFHYDSLRIQPQPTRWGGPPIVITGRKAGAMRRAAQLGDGWMPYLYSAERYAHSVDRIRSIATERDRDMDGFRWMVYVMVAVDDDQRTALRTAAAFLGETYNQDFSRFVQRVSVTGNLDQVVEGLRAFHRAGARHFVLMPCTPSRSGGVAPWLSDLLTELRSE